VCSPFKYAHKKGNQFEQIYYNGGTYWNEEVQTKLETGDNTNVLKDDASQVKEFYDSLGQTTHMEWPGDLTNFELDKCEINAAMCCWPQDRQANDNNGNCDTPYDEQCYDNDPADNTDLCYVDVTRSPLSNKFDDTGYINFPRDDNTGEGAIHCHGFAWSNDEYDFTSRYKANNLFYVSMYDHMHQRGYVRNIPGAPMCACIEQMPTVSRSDCTQIDVDESYRIVQNSKTNNFNAVLTDIVINFNSCEGRYDRNNDLLAYFARLAHEGKVTSDQRASLSKYLVEKERCGAATDYFMAEKGYIYGYNHDESNWFKVAGRDSLFIDEVGREGFRNLLEESPNQIVWRVCASCVPSHQHIYYKRLTAIPSNIDLQNVLMNSWTNASNEHGKDFKLYSTYDDAINGVNEWTFCNFSSSRGFPNECGPTEKTNNQYSRFYSRSGRSDVAFYVEKQLDGGITPLIDSSLSSEDIGNPSRRGDVLQKEGTYYVTAAGNDVWNKNDEFHFVHESGSGDMTLKVYISSLQYRHDYTKAGLMIRESLSSNSANFFCHLTGERGVYAQWRSQTGDDTGWDGYHDKTNGPSPTWLMVSKKGNGFSCSKSVDGLNWESVGDSVEIAMESDVNAGMALVSRDSRLLAEAVFENYEKESFFYPSTSPTVSKSPSYYNFLEEIVIIKNYESDRILYSETGRRGSKGIGANRSISKYSNWLFESVSCNIGKDCFNIMNTRSNECLFGNNGSKRLGAEKYPDGDKFQWYLENVDCGGDICYFIVNAYTNRRLYAETNGKGENDFGATDGSYSDNQKWYIHLYADISS